MTQIAATKSGTKHATFDHYTRSDGTVRYSLLCGTIVRTKRTGEGAPSCGRCLAKLAALATKGN